jgi:hypothetical protein
MSKWRTSPDPLAMLRRWLVIVIGTLSAPTPIDHSRQARIDRQRALTTNPVGLSLRVHKFWLLGRLEVEELGISHW